MSIKGLSLKQLSLNTTPIPLVKASPPSRKVRNRQFVPSDDEYDDDEEEEGDESCNTTTTGSTSFSNMKAPYRPSPSNSTTSSVKTRYQTRKVTTPLPSDDEDEDDDEDSEEEQGSKLAAGMMKQRLYRLNGVQSSSQVDNYMANNKPCMRTKNRAMGDGQPQRHSAGDSNSMVPPVVTCSYDSGDESVLPQQQPVLSKDNMHQFKQWQYMQQYQQAQMVHFQQQLKQQQQYYHPSHNNGYYHHHQHHHHQQQQQQHHHQPQSPYPIKSHSSSSHLRHQNQQQGAPPHQQAYILSGMELLAQREQDIADAKRQKPKLVPAHAKIKGLLAKLPEPGAHNISFQHVYQQHQQRHRSPSPTPTTRSYSPHMMVPAAFIPIPSSTLRPPPRSISAMSITRR